MPRDGLGGKLAGRTKWFIHIEASASVVTMIIALAADRPPRKVRIGRIDVPKSLFPMSTIQAGLYRQAAVFALLFAILMSGGYVPTATWLWFIPIILVNYLLILACGYIAACLVSVVRAVPPAWGSWR